MNEKLRNSVTVVKEKWSDASKMTKVLLVTVPIAIIAIIIVLVVLLNHKNDAVLFSGVEQTEAGQIASAITALGVTDVTVKDNGDIIVPEDQVDYLRMQMYMQGYPTSSTDYEIWNNGVDLWSTDSDKREVKRQQLETRIGAALTTLDDIRIATVTLVLPETADYVLIDDKGVSSCSVVLTLAEGAELTNAEVRAIYRAVTTSAENLINENISIMDTTGRAYVWVDPDEDKYTEVDPSGVTVATRRLQFQKEFEELLYEDMKQMFDKSFGENGYAFNVTAVLNYDKLSVEETEYIPVGTSDHGVIDHEDHVEEGGSIGNDGGLVGVTPNGDESPDYPEYIGGEDGQNYWYEKDEIQYSVSNIKSSLVKDGYEIEKLSVALMVNETNMTEADREALQDLVAKAAGTSVADVSVYNMPFVLQGGRYEGTTVDGNGNISIIAPEFDPYRDILLFVVIGLGVLLIILLILSLFMSSSRKKRIRRRQEAALAAAGNMQYNAAGNAQEQEMPEEVDFNIASLTEEAGKDSRETILKREISEFAKTNPDIVASIIRNMLREE